MHGMAQITYFICAASPIHHTAHNIRPRSCVVTTNPQKSIFYRSSTFIRVRQKSNPGFLPISRPCFSGHVLFELFCCPGGCSKIFKNPQLIAAVWTVLLSLWLISNVSGPCTRGHVQTNITDKNDVIACYAVCLLLKAATTCYIYILFSFQHCGEKW